MGIKVIARLQDQAGYITLLRIISVSRISAKLPLAIEGLTPPSRELAFLRNVDYQYT
jgi:hypothetical protein